MNRIIIEIRLAAPADLLGHTPLSTADADRGQLLRLVRKIRPGRLPRPEKLVLPGDQEAADPGLGAENKPLRPAGLDRSHLGFLQLSHCPPQVGE